MDPRFVAAVVAALGAAGPLGSAQPVLHVIGPHASSAGSICGNVVVHANAAISATLRDDQTLERSIDRLKHVDFEESNVAQRAAVNELRRLSGDLDETSVRGTGEVRRLRDYAERIEEERRRGELTVFADALESALDRQHRMGLDLDRFLAGLTYRAMRDEAAKTPRTVVNPDDSSEPTAEPYELGPSPGPHDHAETPNTQARFTAIDFDERLTEVRRDESHAADLSEAAVGGC